MRRTLLALALTLVSLVVSAQPFRGNYSGNHKYEIVDSLPLERIYIHSQFDYDDDKVIDAGEGEYMIEMPHKDKMVILLTKDRDQAIVVYNSYCFGRHKEFNVKETDKRIVLWYEDDDLFCGYAYDKRCKVCKYFENFDRTKFDELRARMFGNGFIPRFPARKPNFLMQ